MYLLTSSSDIKWFRAQVKAGQFAPERGRGGVDEEGGGGGGGGGIPQQRDVKSAFRAPVGCPGVFASCFYSDNHSPRKL